MMLPYNRLALWLLAAVSAVSVISFVADDDPIAKIKQQLDKWANDYAVEKVHLQLDKPYYAAGEDIWFKAYVTNGALHQLSALSGVLNVELIDERDSVNQFIKLPIANGVTWGDFALPDTLHEGNYRIRAYTNYMRNAGSEYFFNKAITIINTATQKVHTNTAYKYASQNGKPAINSTINFTDNNDVAYVGATVKYSVVLNSKEIAKGKGVTDAGGNLNVSFPAADAAAFSYAKIVTSLVLPDKTIVSNTIPVKVASGKADVQFFPESGTLVSGIASKVAFKAVGTDGMGADIKGTIIDNTGKEIAEIVTGHLGMGTFDILPTTGETYSAKITYPDGSVNTIPLPRAADKGYVISVNNADAENVRVRITTAGTPAQQLSLIAQSNGRMYYAAKSSPGSALFSSAIPKSKLPSGIVQLTLFSGAGEPLAERLVFIQRADQLKLKIASDKPGYARQQKVKLNLDVKNSSDRPTAGSFSVAVTDESKVPVDEDNENNIMADLLLTSDLRGYVERPGYYFNNVTDKTRADLDVLMLTQGYHRFEWKQLMEGKFAPNSYPVESSLRLSGVVTTLSGGPVAKGKVKLYDLNDMTTTTDTITDDQGRFIFNDLIFSDSVRLVVQARTAKGGKDLVITMDKPVPANVTENKSAGDYMVSISNRLSSYAETSRQLYSELLKNGGGHHVINLTEVVIRDKKYKLRNSQNLNGPGTADDVIGPDVLEHMYCARIGDCIQSRIAGVSWRNGIPFTVRGQMAVIVDGDFLEGAQINDLNIQDIQAIEVLRTVSMSAVYGSRAANGAILITTKTAGDRGYIPRALGTGTKAWYPKGFYKVRKFYSPQYDAKENQKVADMRSTIFWKPDVTTGADGKASLDYFNAGSPGTYRVVVEGMDADGKLGRQVYRYKVE